MRFGDFLRVTVLLSAGSATLLAAVTVIAGSREADPLLVFVSVGWWTVATVVGARLEAPAHEQIARQMATAKYQTTLPELRPAATIVNRLWALLLVSLVAAGVGIFVPQVASVAAGFPLLVALAWRRQNAAVAGVEERDSARFYVDRTSPVAGVRLVRTPGFGGDFSASKAPPVR